MNGSRHIVLTREKPGKMSGRAALNYGLAAAGFCAATSATWLLGRIPLAQPGQVVLRPDVALAALLLAIFDWSFLPVVVAVLLVGAAFTGGVEPRGGFLFADAMAATAVAAGTAFFVRRYRSGPIWGSSRDLLVLGSCIVLLPAILSAVETPFFQPIPSTNVFLLTWIGAVMPMAAIVPAGLKLAEWARDDRRPPLTGYLGRGAKPAIQAAQYVVMILAAAFIWAERVSGATGRVYPLYIAVFWVALTSGLPGAAFAFVVAQGLFVTVNTIAHPTTPIFDLLLAATFMGSCSIVAGALVTARQDAEASQRLQGEALRRQLAEMQVIRQLADSIIALEDESALFELGAKAIGEQLEADLVALLWVPAAGGPAESRGVWSSANYAQDAFSADLCDPALVPLWDAVARDRDGVLSRADAPHPKLLENGLDVLFHQSSGVRTLAIRPFSFESAGYYAATILSYRRFRHWSDADLQFVSTVCDQITIALQKMRLLGEREERSRAFARMSQALVADTGESFFRNLTLRLCEAAGSRGAFACRLGDQGGAATMLAFAADGKIRREFAFRTEGTPIPATIREGALAVGDQVGVLYPRLSEITGTTAQGLASTSLVSSDGRPLGALAVYADHPFEDPDHIASILRLFAARLGAEIERLDRERLLRESEASYRRVLETAHEGIWMLDANADTSYVNAGLVSMLGYSPEDIAGKSMLDYVEGNEKTKLAEDFRKQLLGADLQRDLRFRRHDGTYVWTLLSMSPITGEDGEFRGALAMITDISERKRTEQELDRLVHERTIELVASNRELEAFCYSISHDLRQPLRAIDGFSRAAVDDLGNDVPDGVKEHLSRVRRAAHRMSELIDALLTLSRLNRVEMKREKVNLSEIAETALAEMALAEPARANRYSVRKGLTAAGDARLLQIALTNLLSNAWKFSGKSEEPFVEFGVTKLEGRPCFYVRDNGIGFDMAYYSKLFKPFERLHSDSDYFGTGIGLATVARVIDRHGGTIWAQSEEGKGATFYFTLG